MKKSGFLLISLILLTVTPALYAQEFIQDKADLEKLDEFFYEAPGHNLPIVEEVKTVQKEVDASTMPLVKRLRINYQNFFREKSLKDDKKAAEREAAYAKKMMEEEAAEYKSFEQKINNKAKEKPEETEVQEGTPEIGEAPEGVMELTGEVREQVTSSEMVLDANVIEYNEELDEVYAVGNPILKFPNYNIELKADKMTYNISSNILKAIGNVELIKDGDVLNGDFFQINTNEENAFLDNLRLKKDYMTIRARDMTTDENKIIFQDGKIVFEDSYKFKMVTRMIRGTDYDDMMVDDEDFSALSQYMGNTPLKIHAQKVLVDAKKDHDRITIKDATISIGDNELVTLPSFTAYTDKSKSYFEANIPEFGSRSQLGAFIGPGYVFEIPNGATLKAMPVMTYKSGVGIGGLLRYRAANNHTDFGYGTSNSKFIMRGKQQLDDKLHLNYGMNSYMDNWFHGQNMAKYSAEVLYKDTAYVRNSIKEGLDLRFRHRAGIAYLHDGDLNRRNENLTSSDIGTMRLRYMAEIDQALYGFRDKEQRKAFELSMVMQGSAALYGTGDTQLIARVGPKLHTQYKGWMQDLGYFLTGYEDNNPLPITETWRYGHSNVYLREALRVNKYLTLAWRGSFNLSDDALGKKIRECTFFASVGPDDLKFTFGYDVVRKQTYFTIALNMDLKDSELEFEKMEIKNPDKLSRSERQSTKITVFEDNVPVMSSKMKYAEVIEIEDPNKEQI